MTFTIKLRSLVTHDAIILRDFNLLVLKWGEPLTLHYGHDLYNKLGKIKLTYTICRKPKFSIYDVVNLVFVTKDQLVESFNVVKEFSNTDYHTDTFPIDVLVRDSD